MSAPAIVDESPFDPAIHLVPASTYKDMKNLKITLADLGFPPSPVTDASARPCIFPRKKLTHHCPQIAATHPFPLFTVEGIRRLRADAVKHSNLDKYMYSDNNTPCVIRGHAGPDAPFIYQAWKHPETHRRVQEFAGLKLEPVFDYELGHTNIQLGPRGWAGLKAEPDLLSNKGDVAEEEEIKPTVYEVPNWSASLLLRFFQRDSRVHFAGTTTRTPSSALSCSASRRRSKAGRPSSRTRTAHTHSYHSRASARRSSSTEATFGTGSHPPTSPRSACRW